jgi:hypothetical protein
LPERVRQGRAHVRPLMALQDHGRHARTPALALSGRRVVHSIEDVLRVQ